MDGTQSDEKDAMDVEEHGVEGRVSLCPGLTLLHSAQGVLQPPVWASQTLQG